VLRHRTEPRLKGVPLAVALGWYNVAYGTLAVMESILNRADPNKDQRSRTLLAPGTALVATSLDLLVDPFGLDHGLWEWSDDGAYATEIEGPNGKHGVPLLNFIGWLGLIASVTLADQRLDPDDERTRPSQPGAADSPEVGRTAALLLLPYYLPAAVWALKRRKAKYLLYSAPFSVAAWAALRGH
jgi:Carotenoid biosynthesis protein